MYGCRFFGGGCYDLFVLVDCFFFVMIYLLRLDMLVVVLIVLLFCGFITCVLLVGMVLVICGIVALRGCGCVVIIAFGWLCMLCGLLISVWVCLINSVVYVT